MKDKKMVLFDWNGTLIDDTSIWLKSVGAIFELRHVKLPPAEEYFRRMEELKSLTEVYNSFGIGLTAEELNRIYQEEYQKHLKEIQLSQGAIETLKALKKRKIILGIVSAQLKTLFDAPFLRFNLEQYFDEVIVGTQNKDLIIASLYALKGAKPENCYYVGDTPSDIRNAKKAGVKSVAYLNKHIPAEMLLSQGPDFTISDLREIPGIIKTDQKEGPNG